MFRVVLINMRITMIIPVMYVCIDRSWWTLYSINTNTNTHFSNLVQFLASHATVKHIGYAMFIANWLPALLYVARFRCQFRMTIAQLVLYLLVYRFLCILEHSKKNLASFALRLQGTNCTRARKHTVCAHKHTDPPAVCYINSIFLIRLPVLPAPPLYQWWRFELSQ